MGDLIYGLVGAEQMFDDPAEVYEREIEPWYEPTNPVAIEEWSTYEPVEHLPLVDQILAWIGEWTIDDGEVDEGWDGEFTDAMQAPEVAAAAEALRAAIAGRINYRMAKECLRTLTLTWGEDGQPLLDGTPLYASTGTATTEEASPHG